MCLPGVEATEATNWWKHLNSNLSSWRLHVNQQDNEKALETTVLRGAGGHALALLPGATPGFHGEDLRKTP